MSKEASRRDARERRHRRVRKKIEGTTQRPRLCPFRSLAHIYAQIVDDRGGHTLAAASTLDRELRGQLNGRSKTEQAGLVGQLVGERARQKGIVKVVFDRGGYRYHGRVKGLAEGARQAGLEF